MAGAPSDGGSIHGQADAAAGFKSLVALGLAQHPCQSGRVPVGSKRSVK
jgi:hypothetical protein